jgi:TRAP-type C4-dicarboxylate transport system permease small subunit
MIKCLFNLVQRIETMMSRRNKLRASTHRTMQMFLQTMITLASASLGLVAALAWNDAIKATFKQILGEADSLPALYTYATLATIFAVGVVGALAWLSAKVGGDAAINREAEG